jgi:Fe-S-cluster-containing dehydrogenase component
MSKYYLFQDTKKCIGCHACEVQCKANKNLPIGPRLCQIVQVGPKMIGGLPRAAYIFMPCFHCENPWCVAACPTGAMQQRSSDGIVFVDHSLCVGCKTCISACPWGAPQWNPETGRVVKCDYCMDRVDQGLKPACVTDLHHPLSQIRQGRGDDPDSSESATPRPSPPWSTVRSK